MNPDTFLRTLLSGPGDSIDMFQLSCGIDSIKFRSTGKGAIKSCTAKLYKGKKPVMTITVKKNVWSVTGTLITQLIMSTGNSKISEHTHRVTEPQSLFKHFQYNYKKLTGLDPYLFTPL